MRHAFGLDDDSLDESDPANFGRAADLSGAEQLEGCELRNGSLDITDSGGATVAEYSLESDEFKNFVDDVHEIDIDSHTVNGGPTLIARTSYSGSVHYETQPFAEPFDEAGWYVALSNMGGEPFISTLNFENETLQPEGSGSFGLHEVWLNVPDSDGKIRQIYHSAHPDISL